MSWRGICLTLFEGIILTVALQLAESHGFFAGWIVALPLCLLIYADGRYGWSME